MLTYHITFFFQLIIPYLLFTPHFCAPSFYSAAPQAGEYEVEEEGEGEGEDDDEAELQSAFNARERRGSENDEVKNVLECVCHENVLLGMLFFYLSFLNALGRCTKETF